MLELILDALQADAAQGSPAGPLVGDALMCYRCQAQYRGVAEMDSHGAFDLETHERHRQLNARLKTAQRV